MFGGLEYARQHFVTYLASSLAIVLHNIEVLGVAA
jgi:hypothetical protein